MTPSRKRFPGTVFALSIWALLIPFVGSAGVLGLACLSGCASHAGADLQSRSLYVTEHPDISGPFARAVMAGQIMIGMTPEMVQAAWGQPQRVENRRLPAGSASATTPAELADAAGTSADTDRARSATRNWEMKLVYGNYLVNPMVSNLYFEGGRLSLIESVDTKSASSTSQDDPNVRILLPGRGPAQGGPAKGGGQIQ